MKLYSLFASHNSLRHGRCNKRLSLCIMTDRRAASASTARPTVSSAPFAANISFARSACSLARSSSAWRTTRRFVFAVVMIITGDTKLAIRISSNVQCLPCPSTSFFLNSSFHHNAFPQSPTLAAIYGGLRSLSAKGDQ